MDLIQKIADWYYFELRFWLKIPIFPNYWIKNGPVDKKWDQKLKAMLIDRENLKIENHSRYDIKINDKIVWSRNYPFAAFGFDGREPSRRRVMLLMEILKEDYPA